MTATPGNERSSQKLGRRLFLAGAASAAPLAFWRSKGYSEETKSEQAIDFSRSFCHYDWHRGKTKLWVRVQIECRCEVFDRSTGQSDEYLLSVRVQTGLRTDPLSDVQDPGYDFWFIFSRRHVYIRRTLASSYGDSSTRVPPENFKAYDWHIHRSRATPLTSGIQVREALKDFRALVARTEFTSADGMRGYSIEYPVKWADGNPDDTFRVETGPVVLLDPERARVGVSPELDDFQWAYLDYRDLESTKLFLERPTPVLSGTVWRDLRRNTPLTTEQRKTIEDRLFKGWEPPVPADALEKLFQRNHFSTAERRKAVTKLYALA